MKLEVQLHDEPRGQGLWVRGNVRVLEGGRSRSLSVSLQYRERSPAFTHTAIDVAGPVLHTGDLQAGASFEFAIQMPGDALPGQTLAHGETFWQVDAKSDEAGLDTHAFARVETAPAAAPAPVGAAPPPPGPPPVDSSGTPLLAPGYGAGGERRRSKTGAAILTAVLTLAAGAVGVWAAVEEGDSGSSNSVPVYTPQPYTPPPYGEFDLNACQAAAAGDPEGQLDCIREYNRRITEER